jgi:RNA recognition motif-containing protein
MAEGRRIYVGNLVYQAQPSDITDHFTAAGYTVSRLAMSMDPFTGRNPSYCFVELDSKEAAEDAMQKLDGTSILGRRLKIRPCVPKTKEHRGRWAPGHLQSDSNFDRWARNNADAPNVNQEQRRLHVSGLPKRETQAEYETIIRELFEGFEVQMISKVISPRGTPGKHYFGFVDFENAEVAREAQRKVDGRWIEGEGVQVRVSLARGEPRGIGQTGRWKSKRDDGLESGPLAEPHGEAES